MGLTIVHKSDLSNRKKDPRIALVLAGGAVTGGAYKLGGLKALDDFLVNRKTTDFDIYVGLSAGAFLAAPLAGGVTPPEMLRALEGASEDFTYLSPLDFYTLNFREFAEKPVEFLVDLITYFPNAVYDFLVQTPSLVRSLQEPIANARRRPSLSNLIECVKPLVDAVGGAREFPFPLAYMPSGLFDNSSLERYLRHNIERRGMTNDFRVLYRLRQVELYIVAMNLDTAERVVFGHDEDTSVTISEAVQASTALPGFYKPARVKGVDYVDGGVRRTANIDVAIEHGADLVICYNPFRPFSNRVRRHFDRARGTYTHDGPLMAEGGVLSVLNQVFRTLLHSRLQYGLREYQDDPNFQGDILVIEPKESDVHFFHLNALSYWERLDAARLGYASVTDSIEQNYELVKTILERYGLTLTRREVRQSMDKIREENVVEATEALTREVPRRRLRVA